MINAVDRFRLRTPAQRELFALSDNIDRNEQIIEQELNLIAQIEALLPPEVVQEVRQLSEDRADRQAERERLIDQLADLQDECDTVERHNRRFVRKHLVPQQHRLADQHETHQRILDQLSVVLSQVPDQVKRYEDRYGALDW